MRLAGDGIHISVAGEAIELRPSLRAAMRLERRHGYQKLLRDIVDGKLATYVDVIGEFATLPFPETQVWEAGLDTLQPQLLAFLMALAGTDDDAPKPAKDDGPPIPYAEYYATLYRIGTGWLGWSPETTWNATPAEITEAYKGRLAKLRAMLGASDDAKSSMSLDQKFALAFRSMGARVVRREH